MQPRAGLCRNTSTGTWCGITTSLCLRAEFSWCSWTDVRSLCTLPLVACWLWYSSCGTAFFPAEPALVGTVLYCSFLYLIRSLLHLTLRVFQRSLTQATTTKKYVCMQKLIFIGYYILCLLHFCVTA